MTQVKKAGSWSPDEFTHRTDTTGTAPKFAARQQHVKQPRGHTPSRVHTHFITRKAFFQDALSFSLPYKVMMREHWCWSYGKPPCSNLSPFLSLSLSLSRAIWMTVPVKTHDQEDLPLICLKWKGEERTGGGSDPVQAERFALIVCRRAPIVYLSVTLAVTGRRVPERVEMWWEFRFMNFYAALK